MRPASDVFERVCLLSRSVGIVAFFVVLAFAWYLRRHGCSVRKMMDYGEVLGAARKGDLRGASKKAEELSEENDDNMQIAGVRCW